MLVRITPKNKNAIYETETWQNEETFEEIDIETIYESGEFDFEVDSLDELDFVIHYGDEYWELPLNLLDGHRLHNPKHTYHPGDEWEVVLSTWYRIEGELDIQINPAD